MKKLLFLAFAMPFFSGAYAQHSEGTTFGVRAGINFQNINGKDDQGRSLNNKIRTGYNLGVNAEIPITSEFYFQPGLLFTTKGAKNTSDPASTVTTYLNYMELPLNFLYKGAVGSDKVLVGFGPYVAYGVGGKVTEGSQIDKVKYANSPGTAANTVYVKPFDAGANILLGWEFSGQFSAQLNAQLGLAQINPYPKTGKEHNTGFGVSLGYRFAK